MGNRTTDTLYAQQEAAEKAARLAAEKAERLKESAEELYEEGLRRARDLGSRAEGALREKPLQSVLIATAVGAGIGLLAGFLMRR